MKLPAIPMPEPRYMITVSRGSAASRRPMVSALRFLLWGVPAAAVDYALAVAGAGRHSPWMTLAATYVTIGNAVLLVNVEPGGEDAP